MFPTILWFTRFPFPLCCSLFLSFFFGFILVLCHFSSLFCIQYSKLITLLHVSNNSLIHSFSFTLLCAYSIIFTLFCIHCSGSHNATAPCLLFHTHPSPLHSRHLCLPISTFTRFPCAYFSCTLAFFLYSVSSPRHFVFIMYFRLSVFIFSVRILWLCFVLASRYLDFPLIHFPIYSFSYRILHLADITLQHTVFVAARTKLQNLMQSKMVTYSINYFQQKVQPAQGHKKLLKKPDPRCPRKVNSKVR